MGARKYELARELEFQGNVLEIGSERGEGSTAVLAQIAADKGVPFYSVDVDPKQTERAAGAIGDRPGVAVNQDGAAFLREFQGSIGFAYLDNFDYWWPSIIDTQTSQNQHAQYRALGLRPDNDASRRAHLVQTMEIMKRPWEWIMLDDTWATGLGFWLGKGSWAVPYALTHGATVYRQSQPPGDWEDCKDGWILLRNGG